MEAEIRQVRDAIKVAETAHAQERAAADKVAADLRSADVDFSKDADAFAKIDDAYKAADARRDEVSELRKREARLLDIVGERADEKKDSSERRDARGVAERYMASAEYRELQSSGVLSSSAALGNGRPVEVATRDELIEGLRTRTTVDNSSGSGGGLIWSDRLSLVVPKPVRKVRLVDLLTVGATNTDTIEWANETTVTDSAAETAYGTAAPESAYGWTKTSTTVKRIPHFVPATKGALADGGQLRTLLENRLARGLMLRIETQALSGGGTGEDFEGIATVSGTATQALSTDTRFDAVHKAITKVRIAWLDDGEPNAIGMHPTDYESILLEKDADGNYVHGRAAGEGSIPTLWGLVPVVSTLFTAGTVWVGDFAEAYLWIRAGVSISASDSHSDYFTKGLVVLLAEMRAAFKVVQPKAFCKITGF